MVAKNANYDLMIAAASGTTISVGAFHANLVKSRMANGFAVSAFGHNAVEIVVPTVESLSWEDVRDLRRNRGIEYFRGVLREIESAAWSESTSLNDLGVNIEREYGARLRDHNLQNTRDMGRRLSMAAFSLAVGVVTSHLAHGAPVSGIIGAAVPYTVGEVQARIGRNRWIAFDEEIRHRADRRVSR